MRIGFEQRYASFMMYSTLAHELGKGSQLVPVANLVEPLRSIKSAEEMVLIKRATEITMNALRFIKPLLKPGMTELQVAAEIERFIRQQGARCASFDIIVASGPHTSYPHHITSERELRPIEPVIIDMGVDYRGYKSDLTRVFFLGKINLLCKRIYAIACQAQQRAFEALHAGVSLKSVDRVSRQYISKHGFGRNFGHSLGHGVGLEIHEAPMLSVKSSDILQEGMVFTVEPGIYVDGVCGVRIEDMVYYDTTGPCILSADLDK
jgi:Xaa-Pro aminopeptidase